MVYLFFFFFFPLTTTRTCFYILSVILRSGFLFSPFSMITSLSDLARQPGIYLLLAFMWLKPLIPSPGSRRGFPFPAVPRAFHSCSNGFFFFGLLFCIFSHLSSPRRSQPGSLRIRRCSSTLSSISLCGLSATSKLP